VYALSAVLTIKDKETGREISLGCNLTVGGGSFNKVSFQYESLLLLFLGFGGAYHNR
jgi:hypothetical protein